MLIFIPGYPKTEHPEKCNELVSIPEKVLEQPVLCHKNEAIPLPVSIRGNHFLQNNFVFKFWILLFKL
jgi:hypothetical protein